MAVSTRRFTNVVAALSLLASLSCQQCSAFVATRSSSLQQARRRSGVINTSNLFVGRKTCSYRSVEVRGYRVSSSRATRMLVPPSELWSSYLQALEAAPLLTKSITAGVIFPAADAVAQFVDNDDNKGIEVNGWDFARTFRWLLFGFAVQAPWNHFFYVLLDGALPPTPEPFSATTGIKVFIDQFVQAPVFTVVIFGVLGLLEGKTAADIREKLNRDYKSTMIANWGVFVPAAVVNLAFCPPELRVLFLNVRSRK